MGTGTHPRVRLNSHHILGRGVFAAGGGGGREADWSLPFSLPPSPSSPCFPALTNLSLSMPRGTFPAFSPFFFSSIFLNVSPSLRPISGPFFIFFAFFLINLFSFSSAPGSFSDLSDQQFQQSGLAPPSSFSPSPILNHLPLENAKEQKL